jgi:hypothetical protein
MNMKALSFIDTPAIWRLAREATREAGLGPLAMALVRGALLTPPDAPFRHLPPAADERERQSRAQAGIAINIHRALLQSLDPQRALAVSGRLIEAGALAFLAKTLPDVSAAALANGTQAERAARVRAWFGRFFTATGEVVETTDKRVVFHVHGCALVRLVAAAGHPELGPLFCKGDQAFFAHRQIRLTRPTRLAIGHDHCRFELTRDD